MNLLDFNPARVVVLDWFPVIEDIFPDVNIADEPGWRPKLEDIIKYLDFSFIADTEEPNSVYWVSASLKEDMVLPNKLKKKFNKFVAESSSWALDWLLPSGIILADMEHKGAVSSFTVNGKKYASFVDGVVVSLKPEVHPIFVDFYVNEQNQQTVIGDLEYLEVG